MTSIDHRPSSSVVFGTVDAAEFTDQGSSDGSFTRRLFGRITESAALADALARVRASGRSEIVLLSGVSGVGKSALVRRFRMLMAASPHRFTAGKCDQLHHNAPFVPIAQALKHLAHGLLGESDAMLESLRASLLPELGNDTRLVVDLVPDMEIVLGTGGARTDMSPALAKVRLHKALLATIAALATREAPLILFLDDIQWADPFSLEMLMSLAADPPANTLVILAYREDEAHVYLKPVGFLDGIGACALPVTPIALAALAPDSIVEMLEHTFGGSDRDLRALGHAIHAKTGGNPFFVQQVLGSLREEGVIRYDEPRQCWIWTAQNLETSVHAGNVVDFTGSRVERLPGEQREVLQSLALIGSRADGGLLGAFMDLDRDPLEARTRPLVEAGFLHRDATHYAFAHDRIMEVSIALTPEADRPVRHAALARLMLEQRGTTGVTEFDIADHVVGAMVSDVAIIDRPLFARALVDAADRALQTAAVDQVTRYMEGAKRLSSDEWWQTHYTLAFDIDFRRIENLLQIGAVDVAERAIDALLGHAAKPIDKARVYRLKAVTRTLHSDYDGSIAAGLAGLALLGVDLHRFPAQAECDAAYERVRIALGDAPIASLADLPKTDDPQIEAIMALLSTMIAAVFADDGLRFIHVAKIVEFTLAHGATAGSAYGLAWFGVFVCDFYGQYADGFEYGLAALALVDRHGFETQRTGTLVALDQLSPWTQPFSYAVLRIREAIAAGHAAGDLGMTCYARNHLVTDLLMMGAPLSLVEEEAERGLQLTRRINFRDIELLIGGQYGLMRQLSRNETMPPFESAGEITSASTRFWVRLNAGMAAYFFKDYARASQVLDEAELLSWALPANIDLAYLALFSALTAAQYGEGADALRKIEVHRARLATWAQLNPRNFENKRLLVEAEMARLRGEGLGALQLYDRAIEASGDFGHERAMAHELAARHCIAIGLGATAAYHGRAARTGYRDWGATAKATLLETDHPDWFGSQQGDQTRDVDTVLDLAQSFSQELAPDRLTELLTSTMIERSGAQRGLLMILRDGEPVIESMGVRTPDGIEVSVAAVIPTAERIDPTILNTVMRTQTSVVTGDRQQGQVLSIPLLQRNRLLGIVHLEHCPAESCSPSGVALMERIAAVASIALGTAHRHAALMEEDARRAQTENALRAARAELAQTSHLSVMGGLAASIAHEIGQPLAAIVSHAGASIRWLKRAEPNVPEAVTGLQQIKDGGLRAADIVRGLRALARQEPASREPVILNAVVRDVLELTAAEIDERAVVLIVHLDEAESVVIGDYVQLQQVVLNLVMNAIDAMGGVPEAERALTVTTHREEASVAVRVEDSGTGISPEHLARIFTPLFTTKSKGMGMGLAICKSIVEAHGGRLTARHADKRGTVFTFELPSSTEGAVPGEGA
jgi:predicted ATPase/signal transduction histidine kinase